MMIFKNTKKLISFLVSKYDILKTNAYSFFYYKKGRGVRVKNNFNIKGKYNILLSDNVFISKNTNIEAHYVSQRPGLIIGKGTKVSDYVKIVTRSGYIKIGYNCTINSFCHISGQGGLSIGNNVRIANNCTIIPSNHTYDKLDIPIFMQKETRRGIKIGNDVWIGSNVVILDGVSIGDGVVIGAGSVVTKSIEPLTIVAGVPAKKINSRG